MRSEHTLTILAGQITELGDTSITAERIRRVSLLPELEVSQLRVGMLVLVRARRQETQYIAERIEIQNSAPRQGGS